MKAITALITKLKACTNNIAKIITTFHKVIIAVLAVLTLGLGIWHIVRGGEKTVIIKKIVQGNIIKVPSFNTITNSITNIILLYADFTNYSLDPFVFVQQGPRLNVSLYKRNANYTISQWAEEPHWMSTVGWNVINTASIAEQYRFLGPLWLGGQLGYNYAGKASFTNLSGQFLFSASY